MGSGVFWAITGGFLIGVFARSLWAFGFAYMLLCVLLSSAALAIALIERTQMRALVLLALALVSCAFGMLRMQGAAVRGDASLTARLGQHVVLEGEVAAEPDARETSTLLTVRTARLVASSSAPVAARVLVLLPAHAQARYGDRVRVSGTLVLPDAFDTGGGRVFEYPEYLAAQGIAYQLRYAKVDVEGGGGNPLAAAAFSAKEVFLRGAGVALPEPEAALAGGITVGDKRSIGPELSAAFERDSLTHMLVLSGYNITVVLNAIAYVLRTAGRLPQFAGALAVVGFFSLVSGGAASALRAGIMALVAVAARMTRRMYIGERALMVASFVMVAWNPWTLVYDPGFQLSALATLGLVLFTPLFAALLSRVPERFGVREILASSCATQVMVLPLLLYQNGTLSLVALPANVLALLPVPLAMLFSFVAALAGIFLAPAAPALALPAYVLLWYVITVARAFSALPYAALSLPAFGAWWLVLAYAALFVGWAYGTHRLRPSDA